MRLAADVDPDLIEGRHGSGPDVIGRESELAILGGFLDSVPTGPIALLLSGDLGIWKTTVWKEAPARRRAWERLCATQARGHAGPIARGG